MVDCQCHGNLGFSGFQFLIGIVVTHANIFSSGRSSSPRGSAFTAGRNALLPRMDFTEEAIFEDRPNASFANLQGVGPADRIRTCMFRRKDQAASSTNGPQPDRMNQRTWWSEEAFRPPHDTRYLMSISRTFVPSPHTLSDRIDQDRPTLAPCLRLPLADVKASTIPAAYDFAACRNF